MPVLHLEAHGGDFGFEGPDGAGGTELLSWDELTEPLQRLNLVTRCNLIVVVAACTGFAGIQALVRGPRAPAVALVGPDAKVMPSNLLSGTKEFYRRWLDESPKLNEIAASASQQAGSVAFEVEPFAVLAYEAMVESLITSMRPNEQRMRVDRIRQRVLAEGKWSAAEIERRLTHLPQSIPSIDLQRVWDEMFMIDLYPENRERFGIDMTAIVELIGQKQAESSSKNNGSPIKQILIWGGVILALFLGGVIGKTILRPSSPGSAIATPSIIGDQALVKLAEDLNQQLPMMVDQGTRLDFTRGGPGKQFTYSYTLMEHRAADFDPEKLSAVWHQTFATECALIRRWNHFLGTE
jgi:hypothetical protein